MSSSPPTNSLASASLSLDAAAVGLLVPGTEGSGYDGISGLLRRDFVGVPLAGDCDPVTGIACETISSR